MAFYIEDYAFITEFLYGGYTYRGSGVRQCSKKMQKLFSDNDIGGIINYRDYILKNNFIDSQWVNKINKFSALRYLILCSFHDAEITAIVYNEPDKRLEVELLLFNCCHGLALSETDGKKQKIILVFSGIENCKNILNEFVFDREIRYSFIQHRLDVNNKINIKIQTGVYGNLSCREFWIELQCDETYIFEKH